MADSLCDATIRFKINDAYRTKSDVTKSLFGAPGSNAPALFELANPKIKQAKRADGFYGWTLRGPLSGSSSSLQEAPRGWRHRPLQYPACRSRPFPSWASRDPPAPRRRDRPAAAAG